MTGKDFSTQTTCLQCGGEVTLRQPADHSEYAPCGTCSNCGAMYAALEYQRGNATVIYVGQAPKKEVTA